ncbi:MAG: 5-formyltetrahydrofolate cyclo-ligase [bacterium]|nr:5-formyltetrahydrofolate cyclo-ligase [bacterium]
MKSKSEIRREVLHHRDQLPVDLRKTWSQEIVNHIQNNSHYQQAHVIAMYYHMGSEVDVLPLLCDTSKQFVFPKIVNRDSKVIRFAPIVNSVVPGIFNTMEPDGDIIDNSLIDLFLVPVVAFTIKGERIGYGAGYYDRLLSMVHVPRIGIAYMTQIIDEIPVEPHDVLLHQIIVNNQ